jgi:hypothetical protein
MRDATLVHLVSIRYMEGSGRTDGSASSPHGNRLSQSDGLSPCVRGCQNSCFDHDFDPVNLSLPADPSHSEHCPQLNTACHTITVNLRRYFEEQAPYSVFLFVKFRKS